MSENYTYMTAEELNDTNDILAETRNERDGKTIEVSQIILSADFCFRSPIRCASIKQHSGA